MSNKQTKYFQEPLSSILYFAPREYSSPSEEQGRCAGPRYSYQYSGAFKKNVGLAGIPIGQRTLSSAIPVHSRRRGCWRQLMRYGTPYRFSHTPMEAHQVKLSLYIRSFGVRSVLLLPQPPHYRICGLHRRICRSVCSPRTVGSSTYVFQIK
jgi:hypothetical protein